VGLDGIDWGCGCWDGKSYGLIRIFIDEKSGNGDGDIQEVESSWSLWPRGSVIYGVTRSEVTTITIYHREKPSDQMFGRMNFSILPKAVLCCAPYGAKKVIVDQ
jgi:hypothetical protein